MLLPLPWFRRSFRPAELQIELIFSPEPSSVKLDLGAVAVTLDDDPILPSRVVHVGRRPAPRYSAYSGPRSLIVPPWDLSDRGVIASRFARSNRSSAGLTRSEAVELG